MKYNEVECNLINIYETGIYLSKSFGASLFPHIVNVILNFMFCIRLQYDSDFFFFQSMEGPEVVSKSKTVSFEVYYVCLLFESKRV